MNYLPFSVLILKQIFPVSKWQLHILNEMSPPLSRDFASYENFVPNKVRPSRIHDCVNCKKSYSYKCDLIRHQKLVCGKEPQFKCQYCSKRCFYKYALQSHIRHRHPEILTTYN